MKFYLGVTDNGWFNFLRNKDPQDVNFWQPGGKTMFKILDRGAPFLFKLKSPINMIGGIGFFSSHSFLPISVAWDVFGDRNGCNTYQEFQRMILQYRKERTDLNPTIGCIILTNPIFFKKEEWLPIPTDWKSSIVQGKTYSNETLEGSELWNKIEILLQKYLFENDEAKKSQLILEEPDSPHYGKSILTKVRLGQGAFRILVTDAYKRKCAISGERTLPVLEAAHIKRFSESGPHFISNSLLLRSDIHKLFDSGYITITTNFKIEVSKRIKEEYENGREYYKYHGESIVNLPLIEEEKPALRYIEWHNENVYNS